MQIRLPLAAVLLSCSALAQQAPGELRPIPKPFDSKPRQFNFGKRFLQAKPAATTPRQAPKAQSDVCSIPLTNVTGKHFAAKMPTITPDSNRYSMAFVTPPAPACEDKRSADPQVLPEPQP